MILLELTKITMIPTATIMVLAEILFETLAAIGDAIALPITKPATAYQCKPLNMVTKVNELIKAIKNLLSLTVPKEYRAFLPPAIKDDKTIEPHPPPPTASINPPVKPKTPIFLIFLSADMILFTLNAFFKITKPKIKV